MEEIAGMPRRWRRKRASLDGRNIVVDDQGWRYAEEDARSQEAFAMMEIWYEHPKTIAVKFTYVTQEEQRKCEDRGWTNFESAVSDCKEGLVCDMRGLTAGEQVSAITFGMFSHM